MAQNSLCGAGGGFRAATLHPNLGWIQKTFVNSRSRFPAAPGDLGPFQYFCLEQKMYFSVIIEDSFQYVISIIVAVNYGRSWLCTAISCGARRGESCVMAWHTFHFSCSLFFFLPECIPLTGNKYQDQTLLGKHLQEAALVPAAVGPQGRWQELLQHKAGVPAWGWAAGGHPPLQNLPSLEAKMQSPGCLLAVLRQTGRR